jgi:hypothetical protein
LATKANYTEEQGRSGESIDEPARGDPRDPSADQRNGLPTKKQAVVSMSQCAKESRGLLVGHQEWEADAVAQGKIEPPGTLISSTGA